MYTQDDIKAAVQAFYRLLDIGELTAKDPLLPALRRPEIQEVLSILADEAAMTVLYNLPTAAYLLPREPFSIFSYRNEELVKIFGGTPNNDKLYTCYVIIMIFLAEFYSSNNYTAQSRDFISFRDFFSLVNDTMDAMLARPEIDEVSQSANIRFSDGAKYWTSLNSFDPRANRQVGGQRSDQVSYMEKVLGILQNHKFITVDNLQRKELSDNSIIYVTPKLTAFMVGYYGNEERKKQLLKYIREGVMPNAMPQ
jgi:hypothetical protein